MIEREVLMIRVYLSEHEARLPKVLALLHDDLKVRGLTVFRAMSGYGNSGRWHTSNLVDLSLDLPIVVEFFDEPTLALMRDRGAFLIPTLSVVHAVIREGVEAGFPAELREKMFAIYETGTRVVEMAHRAGVKLVYGGFRGIVGPKGLTPEQIAYWEGVLHKATQIPEWKSNLEKNYWSDEFLTGKAFRKDLDETYDAMKSVLVDLGLAK